MRRFLSTIVDLRKGEGLLTLLMFVCYYLILVTYYFLKPARDSLFLVNLGPAQLPLVFILTAVLIAPITALYARANRRLRLHRVIYVTSAVLIAGLVCMRFLLELDADWVFYVFYMWVSIYGALTASQYWLFANSLYTPTQAKRVFPLLSLGGILGAMTGGELTGLIVSTFHVDTKNLIVICMAFLILATGLVAVIRRVGDPMEASRGPARDRDDTFGQLVGMIRRSRHLTYLVGIIALIVATATFVDYQFKTVSVSSFPDEESLTTFLGTFYGRVSLVSLLLQGFLSYRLLRRFGVMGVVSVLPVALVLGSSFMLIAPGLLAAVLMRGSQQAFTYSLDKTGRELLFLPVPIEIKKRTKVFIDMFVDRFARGLAGVALLVLTMWLGLSVRALSVVVIVMLAMWLALLVMVRGEYINAFRQAIRRRELDPSQLAVNIDDPTTLDSIRDALRGGNEREALYALDLLEGSAAADMVDDLAPLVGHPSAEVRRRAVAVLAGLDLPGPREGAERLIRDEDSEVRATAMRYLTHHAEEGAGALVAGYLESHDPRVVASAVRCAASLDIPVDPGKVGALLLSESDEVRQDATRALGDLPADAWGSHLERMAHDDSPKVAREALDSMGRTGDVCFIPALIEALGRARLRAAARQALGTHGDEAVDVIAERLQSPDTPAAIKQRLPSVLARIPTRRSVDALTSHLVHAEPYMRFAVIKALNKIRVRFPDVPIPGDRIDAAFVEETRAYYVTSNVVALRASAAESDAERLLDRVLHERRTENLERAFRLLGLRHPPDDIYNAYLGVVDGTRERRSSAVELLDNLLATGVKRYLFPIIDVASEQQMVDRGRDLFGLDIHSPEQALLLLIGSSDSWVRACALYTLVGNSRPELLEAARRAVDDPDPLVSETARLVVSSA